MFSDGVSRVAYSDADIAGRDYVMGLMRAAALQSRIDPAGNIFASREGRDRTLKPILFGSHIDSVPSGGNFDGELGSLSAIEIVRTLNEHKIKTRHPLEVAIWSNEEGGTIGSRAVVGAVPQETLERVFNGVRMADGLRRIGGDPACIADARRKPNSIHAYLELHIEQSGFLERADVPIGVVDGIVSIDTFDVEVRGFANHAGTTPMNERRDALLAAAKLVEAVQEEVTRLPGRQVGTVGHIDVLPNARNVVPGLVKLSIDLRDLSENTLIQLSDAIQKRALAIGLQTHTDLLIKRVGHVPSALATSSIQSQIEAAAAALDLKTMHLPSGAGHDAQEISQLGPMGMIFVPSQNGISHSPEEYSSWAACGNGADVLLQAILRIDQT
jgi:N-carbamoyl-L-amino-acid hydrolase